MMSSWSKNFLIGLVAALIGYYWRYRKRYALVKVRRAVLVTGAGAGIGRAITKYLVEKGDFVFAMDVNENAVRQVAEELNQGGKKANVEPLCFDVRKLDQVESVARIVKEKYGDRCLNAIVNCAGIIKGGPLVEMETSDLQLVMDINVMGVFHVTRAFFPLLNRKDDNSNLTPRIVNISSEVGYARLSAAFNGPYTMSKMAVEMYHVALKQEMAMLQDTVDCTVVNPGAIGTDMVMGQLKGGAGNYQALAAEKPGTMFREQLLLGIPIANGYMEKHKVPPTVVAEAVYRAIHSRTAYNRLKPNLSWEFEAARLTPQWILDFVISMQFPKSKA